MQQKISGYSKDLGGGKKRDIEGNSRSKISALKIQEVNITYLQKIHMSCIGGQKSKKNSYNNFNMVFFQNETMNTISRNLILVPNNPSLKEKM